MANVGGGGGGGRKRRSVEPSQPGPPKKLSPIAARALAALEGDSSSSSESEDEDDARAGQKANFSPPSTAIRPSLGRKEPTTTSGVDPDDFIVEEDPDDFIVEEEDEEGVIELDDDSSAGSEDEDRGRAGSCGAAASGADQSESNHRPKKARVAPIVHQAARAHETTPDDSPAPDADVGMGDEDIVLPHAPTSKYSDVLSSFLSTAFDDKAMLVLHKSKEGIPLNRGSPRKQDFGRWVSSQRDRVPIVPQMQYRKSKGTSSGVSNQDANPASSTAINAEISSFLVEEGRKLISSPVPTDGANGMRGAPLQIHQQPWQRFDARNGVQHTDPTQQMAPQQMQQFVYQPTAPQYYANHGYNIPQQQHLPQWNQGYQQNGWQYAQPTHNTYMAAATHAGSTAVPGGQHGPPAATTGRASVVHSPRSQLPQQLKPQTASASAPIRLTSTNKEVISKFPVAFAYWPDDEASRKNALSAASGWDAQGKIAARKNAKLASAKKPASNRNASTPDGRGDKYTKRNPTTPPSEPAGSDFPPGWTIKTFERTSSTPGKTSKYKVFYPPGGKAKFRSKKSALIFVDILKEPGIDGEKRAFEVFKSRGHKL